MLNLGIEQILAFLLGVLFMFTCIFVSSVINYRRKKDSSESTSTSMVDSVNAVKVQQQKVNSLLISPLNDELVGIHKDVNSTTFVQDQIIESAIEDVLSNYLQKL